MRNGIQTELKIPDLWYDFYARILPVAAFVAAMRLLIFRKSALRGILEIVLLAFTGYFCALITNPVASRIARRINPRLATVLAGAGLIALSACQAPVSREPIPSREPIHFINVHGHYVPLGPEFPPKSKMAVKFGFPGMPVSEFFASMDRWGVDIFINELSPTTIWKGGTHDDKGIPKLSELYPRRVFSLYGEGLRLLYWAVEKGRDTARHERKFVRLIEEAMQSGKYKGFGEIGLHHMQTVKRANLTIKADHPWMLKLADIAARYDVPIDIHMEATDDTLPALERLLAHNRNTKIVWAHTGWSELGNATADVWERLMTRHPNLYGSIKHRSLDSKYASRKVALRHRDGRIKADWLHLFERFPDRFMIGSDIAPGVFVKHGNYLRHLKRMQKFLRRLPPHLLGPIARDNAIRVFNLPAGGNSWNEKGR